jgi:hypothetical protein
MRRSAACTSLAARLTPILCLAFSPAAVAEPAAADPGPEAHINFDARSAETILYHPEAILEDPDRFWRSDTAYRLVAMWHEYSREPVPRDHWLAGLTDLAGVAVEARHQEPASLLMSELIAASDTFVQEAVPHICSFLPQDGIDLCTTIHFTAETYPRAFQIHDHIVMDITNPYYRGNASAIMNCLVHEVFHIGYGNNQRLRTEIDFDDAVINSMLNSLQNEGMATYVAYTAQHLFPALDDRDYTMLDRKRDVRIRRKQVDALFQRAMSDDPGDLEGASWRTGIQDRGYYVVGAYMARTIDERLGRDALVSTVAEGPRAFVRRYNEIADGGMRLVEFEEPAELSQHQRIRRAALNQDAATLENLLKDYTSGEVEAESALEHTLVSVALLLQHRGAIDLAIGTLEANAVVHPQSSAAYQYLADAYERGGLRQKAAVAYRKSIDLDPDGICAFNSERALAELTGSE